MCDSKVKQDSECCIYTMGYEGSSIEDFIATLKKMNIDTIIDVREFPISRKKGFSKTTFSKELNEAGIKYTHLVNLGCPKHIRDQYKIDNNWEKYSSAFNEYLNSQAETINELAKLSQHSQFCLVCFERDQNFCHRSLIAKEIKINHSVRIHHLGVKKGLAELAIY